MDTYEYQCFSLVRPGTNHCLDVVDVLKILNGLGRDGWQVVKLADDCVYMMRKVHVSTLLLLKEQVPA